MLLRGQNILGYKNYPDDVLERFVALACENGMDIFRIFDALNDTRNLERAIQAVRSTAVTRKGTICYVQPGDTVDNLAIAKGRCRWASTHTSGQWPVFLTPAAALDWWGRWSRR